MRCLAATFNLVASNAATGKRKCTPTEPAHSEEMKAQVHAQMEPRHEPPYAGEKYWTARPCFVAKTAFTESVKTTKEAASKERHSLCDRAAIVQLTKLGTEDMMMYLELFI